jgi:sugar/nucleoside kinase (ribokinase family)
MSTSASLGLDDDRRGSGDDEGGVVLFGAVGRDHFGHTLVSIAQQQSAVDTAGRVTQQRAHERLCWG